MTTTTSNAQDLKELSENGVDLKNVSKVLNETLPFSEQRSNLKSTEIQEITTILQKCANLNGIQPVDSRKVLLNIDCILSAEAAQIEASGNSSQILLDLLPKLVQNTNGSKIDFLEGENLGFTSRALDCSTLESVQLIDTGKNFVVPNGSDAVNDVRNSISIFIADICRNSPEGVGKPHLLCSKIVCTKYTVQHRMRSQQFTAVANYFLDQCNTIPTDQQKLLLKKAYGKALLAGALIS
ncbi:unnamed protein product [Strongylus vulgaris]|uniref:Uncharacterized protein n=1 Tax=Strongylus vulgaris TaxID=40348 RepID=A0A3P7KMJ3_STRVU|nr:unnamed protein product [Strongylus vulgaris]